MPDLLRALASTDLFMPHGHCYLWKPGLVWLHVVSDALIWLAYVAISVTLACLVQRVGNLPFKWMYFAFGIFIVSCGFTHLMEVWTVWKPFYWMAGGIKAVTAIASVGTALLLPPLVPRAVALAKSARAAHERGVRLETAYQDLGSMYEKTRELERLKTDFFANVSHELRTPLALILGPTEKLLAGQLDAEQRRDLEVVARNARTLFKNVNDLLDVSKLEAGRMQVVYSREDLARLTRLAASHFEGLAPERGIAFEVSAPATLPADVDADKIQRVLLNLLSNAFKFTPSGGRIRCALRPDGPRAILEVADSGPGVREEMRQAVFQRFRQGDSGSTRRFGGTGLGLAIAKDFVELHGGGIAVETSSFGGALFRVELPLGAPARATVLAQTAESSAELALAARQSLEELRLRVEAASPSGGSDRPLVLVVEDSPEMNRFVAETLAPEYRVESARDGAEGLRKALESSPDLILSDVMMPGMSGDALVAEVRRAQELDGVPIVLLTAKADDALRNRLLRQGAQDYLTKPFSVEELKARIGNLVTIKRAREVLQRELATQVRDLELLAGEVATRKRELQTALDSMQVAREQAERASQLKTDFLGLVSHELRTPLAALQLQLERLRRDRDTALTPRQSEIVSRMKGASGRLLELIESLLEYARIEAGRLRPVTRPLDPAPIVRDVAEEFRPMTEEKGLVFRVVAPDGGWIESDPRLLRLILVNLVGNAVKYTLRGAVDVRLGYVDSRCRVTVMDSGPGIAESDRARIFEPFSQLEPVDQKHTPGVGLGLALVREMVVALGGTIALDSRLGEGSAFTVEFAVAAP